MVYEFMSKDGGRFVIKSMDISGLVERGDEVGILTRWNCWFVLHSYDELRQLLFLDVVRLERKSDVVAPILRGGRGLKLCANCNHSLGIRGYCPHENQYRDNTIRTDAL